MKQRTEQPNPEDHGGTQPPLGFQKNRGRFREVGGQVTGYYRYAGNRAEIMAHFQHRDQIGKFCQRLQLRLEAEFDLATLKNSASRTRARRIGAKPDRNPVFMDDADQLDLLDLMDVRTDAAPALDPTGASDFATDTDTPAINESAVPPIAPIEGVRNPGEALPMQTKAAGVDRDQPNAPIAEQNIGSQSKPKAKPKAKVKPRRTLDEYLSVIQPLGPVTARDGRERAHPKKDRADASA